MTISGYNAINAHGLCRLKKDTTKKTTPANPKPVTVVRSTVI